MQLEEIRRRPSNLQRPTKLSALQQFLDISQALAVLRNSPTFRRLASSGS
jgi:hypothetical protein